MNLETFFVEDQLQLGALYSSSLSILSAASILPYDASQFQFT